jgi:hypothetical protein
MRKVVVAIPLLAVALAVWLANRKPVADRPHPNLVTSPVAPPEDRSVIQAESVEPIAAFAEQIDTDNSRMEPRAASEPAPATTPATVLQMADERGLMVFPVLRENEKTFALEPRDPLWSPSREAEILGQVAQMSGLRLLTIEVECRTSMCRLQLTQSAASTDSVWRGVPSPVFKELLARFGYDPRPPSAVARDLAARTVTFLTYLPRQDVEGQ